MNSLYNSLGRQPAPMGNPMELMNKFRSSNPVGILQSLGYKIPDGMNNPQQIVNHLLSSGQLMPAQMQRIQQIAGRFSAGAHAVTPK